MIFGNRIRTGSQLTIETLRFVSSHKWLMIFPLLMVSFIIGFYALLIAGIFEENARTHFWSGAPDSFTSDDLTPESGTSQSATAATKTAATDDSTGHTPGGESGVSNASDGTDDESSSLTLGEEVIITDAVYVFFVSLYFFAYIIFTFFNIALAACVLRLFEGKPAGLGYGLYFAANRLPSIFGWAVIGCLVGAILSFIESRHSVITSMFSVFGRLAWGVAIFFVVPVMVAQSIGPIHAVKKSVKLIKSVWGEFIAVNLGIGVIRGVALFVIGLTAMSLQYFGFGINENSTVENDPWAFRIMFLVLPMLAFVSSLFVSALGTVVRVALYYYATEKKAPNPFDGMSLYSALAGKRPGQPWFR